MELKAVGVGANTTRFKGHNAQQAKRFAAIPNLLYCDGNEWGLYRNGELVRPVVRLSGDVGSAGKRAVTEEDAAAVCPLLTDFLSWQPIVPKNIKELAELLAPLCRMLRDGVADALKDPDSSLVQLAKDWRQLLFPDASDEQFADAYAQTVTFALLLARSENDEPLELASAQKALAVDHSLLSRALQVLTDSSAQTEISAPLNLLVRVIDIVPSASLKDADNKRDPWLFFYEDFLAAYDPILRKDAGAYYTPIEVVRAQVRLVDDLLTNKLGKALGFASSDVITLDPAAGTGTYLLGVIHHALSKVETQQGAGAVSGQASALANNLYGFEIMVGPFAVSELRVSRALADRGATLPSGGSHVYLTDTLESPNTTPPTLPLILKPIADQHAKALKVKAEVPVIVCLGNPPYDRHEAADTSNKARTGHWVRWGEKNTAIPPILSDFIEPVKLSGQGGQLKNLYNLYVYFWRWALWKVFESKDSTGPGVTSFITASSYLEGDAFCGMREHMRQVCDEIWILDLGGEGRGTRKSENVFAIQTPVAIAVAVRYKKTNKNQPAKIHYASISEGTREEKLQALDGVVGFASLAWQDCPDEWQAPFRPAGTGRYFDWPLLTDLMPWNQSGVKAGRTWVIAPSASELETRWAALCHADKHKRAVLFKDSPTGQKATNTPIQLPPGNEKLQALAEIPRNAPLPSVVRYAFRSFDRQYIFADARMLDRPGPSLWAAHSEGQVYLTSIFSQSLETGPAVTACAFLPDLHHFSGRGAKDIVPLYRDADGKEPNILPSLLEALAKTYDRKVAAEKFFSYVYGVLAHPAFTERFAEELSSRELRVPLTKDAALFDQAAKAGEKLLWLHTFGQRFVPKGKHIGQIPTGAAKCKKAVSQKAEEYPDKYEYDGVAQTLHVGSGEFSPVSRDVYEFEVSGLKVVQSWLGYRMKKPKGKKSSPLDEITAATLGGWPSEFTTELLELLWVLEATLAEYPAMSALLSNITSGSCFTANELPSTPDAARKKPSRSSNESLF
ncbi:MAG: N-6 DNA methylase [Betaproteobacteria bacterium]|nr:N-6 DNA methylase [Betaproteobacteria bacterium]